MSCERINKLKYLNKSHPRINGYMPDKSSNNAHAHLLSGANANIGLSLEA